MHRVLLVAAALIALPVAAKEDRKAMVERAKGVLEILKNADKDRDGKLSDKEFIGHADLKIYDGDGDGSLSKDEFASAKTELEDRISGKEFQKAKEEKKKKQEAKKKEAAKAAEKKP